MRTVHWTRYKYHDTHHDASCYHALSRDTARCSNSWSFTGGGLQCPQRQAVFCLEYLLVHTHRRLQPCLNLSAVHYPQKEREHNLSQNVGTHIFYPPIHHIPEDWHLQSQKSLCCNNSRGTVAEMKSTRLPTKIIHFYSWSSQLHAQYLSQYQMTCMASGSLLLYILTHWGRVTQICVFKLQLCKTDDANLRF